MNCVCWSLLKGHLYELALIPLNILVLCLSMFTFNSNCNCKGQGQVDRLIENSSATTNFDQFELFNSLFHLYQTIHSTFMQLPFDRFNCFNITKPNIFLFCAHMRSLQKNFDSILYLIYLISSPHIQILYAYLKHV